MIPANHPDNRAHITVRGPGRCTHCSFHVATQGHREGCDGTAEVTPEVDPEWKNLGSINRLIRHAADDPDRYDRLNRSIQARVDRYREQRDGTETEAS